MRFCTAINCMDGRVQLPVIQYLKDFFKADYVDSITEPGPVLSLSEPVNPNIVNSILQRLEISIEKHQSVGLAIVAHHDCAGNPEHKEVQLKQLKKAVDFIKMQYADLKIVALWVDGNWQVQKIES